MIIVERVKVDGRELDHTYSDARFRIRRNDGAIFDDAIDPTNSGRTYIETDEPIGGDVTEADKDAAMRRFGVEV